MRSPFPMLAGSHPHSRDSRVRVREGCTRLALLAVFLCFTPLLRRRTGSSFRSLATISAAMRGTVPRV
jgi:hypothetical protein